MRFVAIDVETANSKFSSICQIGISVFDSNREAEAISLLVDPEDHFDGMNISIHGIDEMAVRGQPNFSTAFALVRHLLDDSVVVSHSPFDKTAMRQACKANNLTEPNSKWLDTVRVARRAWPLLAEGGYGLVRLAKEFGFDFRHHDALEDARVAAAILIKAMDETGLGIEDWLRRVEKPVANDKYSDRIKLEGKSDGPLVGEVCVFTGQMKISRADAARIANESGAAVEPGVSKRTTIVVVGDQDLDRLAGKDKSSKHLKAEELVAKGFPIRILQERDFVAILD
jgi:DNA polymerase-3 subunit epsilon